MLSKKVETALNDQIKKEAFSSQLYLSMASWAENKGYSGSAEFLYEQAEEERMHMLKLFRYVNDREGHALASEIEAPEQQFENIKQLFEEVFKHEKFISESINELVGLCMDKKDFTTQNFLQWYVTEQIEEESTARSILDRLNLLGEDQSKMYLFDRDIMNLRSEQTAE